MTRCQAGKRKECPDRGDSEEGARRTADTVAGDWARRTGCWNWCTRYGHQSDDMRPERPWEGWECDEKPLEGFQLWNDVIQSTCLKADCGCHMQMGWPWKQGQAGKDHQLRGCHEGLQWAVVAWWGVGMKRIQDVLGRFAQPFLLLH